MYAVAVFCALLLTVITTKVSGYAHCNTDELQRCAQPLSELDSGLPSFSTSVSTKADFEKICPEVREALNCIRVYLRRCESLENRRHFKKLFHGAAEMANNLCRNETFQEEYLKHAPCMQRAEPQNIVCLEQYTKKLNGVESNSSMEGITKDAAGDKIKNVCCSLQEFTECCTSTTRSICGNEAADFSKQLLDQTSSLTLQLYCQNYRRQECGLIPISSTRTEDTSTQKM